MTLPGWDHSRMRRKGHCPLCDKPRQVNVSVSARSLGDKAKGEPTLGSSLGSAAVSLCNDHALELFGLLKSEVDKRR